MGMGNEGGAKTVWETVEMFFGEAKLDDVKIPLLTISGYIIIVV